MAKTMTFKSLLAVMFLALGLQVSFAQAAFWTENFNTATNWVHGGTNPGTEVWAWTNDPAAGFQTPNGVVPAFGAATASTGYFMFNSDANLENAHDVTLTGVGNPANCTGKTGVHLRVYTQYFHYTPTAQALVGVSTDGTNFIYREAFVGLPADAIAEGTLDVPLPEADNQAQVWIQFRWVGDFEYHWKVDDLELYEFVVPVHDVTFKVNASQLTVNPAGMFIAGTFNGGTPVTMTNDGGGVWSYTAALEEGSNHLYRFLNGPTGFEPGLDLGPCGQANAQLGGFDRTLTVGSEDVTLSAVCFNSCAPCVVACAVNPNKIICDNMESYNTTQKVAAQNVAQQGAANSWWSTWSGATGTTEDGIVSIEQANSPTKSIKIVSTATTGGPQDLVLKLGNKTTGRYELKWMCYIPAGKQGYYNIQDIVPIGAGAWNLDVFFGANNAGNIQIGAGASLAEFTYPSAEWFEVKHVIDLDNNLLTLWVDGQFVHKMAYPNNLGGIDFYGTNNFNQYYIDDVEYVSLPALVYNVDNCDAAVDLTLYFGQSTTQTTGIYDNTNATASASDPAVDCWGEDVAGPDIVNTSMWYTFYGDGETYHIETVPCDATNYITGPGDTQMLIYSGDNCNDLTEVACNDDLSFAQFGDWRAGLDLETVAGQNYYMLIDGFDGSVFGGVLSVGEFCIEISKVASVPCESGVVGTYEMSSTYLCDGAQLADLITIDPASFTLTNEGPISGLAWAVTSAPVDPNNLPTEADILVGSTGFLADPFAVGYVNVGPPNGFPYNIYYITPIVVGGGVDGDPSTPAVNLFDIDVTNGCFYIGQSSQVVFLPLTDDISATATVGAGSVNLTPAGGIADIIGDPASYTYLWSNGATTQDLSGVPTGTYTCTVSDACSLSGTVSATVIISGTEDPASIQSFVLSPNPTSGIVNVNLALVSAAEVRIEVLNTLGQTLQTINAGKLSNLNQNVDLSNMAQGAYFLRVTVDGETAIRRVAVQR